MMYQTQIISKITIELHGLYYIENVIERAVFYVFYKNTLYKNI